MAQVWVIEKIAAPPASVLRSAWHSRTIWITLHCSIVPNLLTPEASAFSECLLLERTDLPQLFFKSAVESVGNIELSLGPGLLAYEPEDLFQQKYLEFSVHEERETQEVKRSNVPVLLADSGAIEAMAEAQDDQEAATQAELKSSRVSYRLVRRDAAET